jgi:hypothetical protein
MGRTIAQLQSAAAGRPTDAAVAQESGPRPPDFSALMQAMKAGARPESPHGLIDAGLRLLEELLKKR